MFLEDRGEVWGGYICLFICLFICMFVCMYVCMMVMIVVYSILLVIFLYIHIHIYIYIHTHIHIYIYRDIQIFFFHILLCFNDRFEMGKRKINGKENKRTNVCLRLFCVPSPDPSFVSRSSLFAVLLPQLWHSPLSERTRWKEQKLTLKLNSKSNSHHKGVRETKNDSESCRWECSLCEFGEQLSGDS